jgi:predicted dehydrogenase
MIDHELRFNPNRARVQALIADGSLGEVRHVIITNIGPSWNDPASRPRGDWWSLATEGGGRLGANGSHQVDLLRWWLGEVAWITGAAPDSTRARPSLARSASPRSRVSAPPGPAKAALSSSIPTSVVSGVAPKAR